jgi:SAM-dependent methyltransferase
VNDQTRSAPAYVLGSQPHELARLDAQARSIEPATRLLLKAAGIGSAVRVLDLGTGLGHVAQLAAELAAVHASVIGIDQSAEALAEARRRAQADTRISFVQGDVTSWRDAEPFDFIVSRLLLFHVAEPVRVARHHVTNLRPDGQFVAIDFDIGAARSVPAVALVEEALDWVRRACTAAGLSPTIGARLGVILEEAGLQNVTTFGVQAYLPPRSPVGPVLLAGAVRSLTEAIVGHRIATAEQIGLDTLEQRVADALARAQAVLMPPTVAGAWGKRAAT